MLLTHVGSALIPAESSWLSKRQRRAKGGEMSTTIGFTLNGRPVTLDTDPNRILLWVLRTDLEMTGAKYGCGAGLCGSCTVVVDGEAVRSCVTSLGDVQGREVATIEGLARNGQLHPLQQAFHEAGGFQCGYCTPGMIMNAYSLLLRSSSPTRDEIVEGMENNLCRCGAHTRIIEAIEMAAGQPGDSHE
jgi:aerobic-type carbon monoxide dehydrogenase small subunit (CoxS/CutS family)